MSQNVEFVEGLFAGAAAMDKQAVLAALPEIIAQTCDPEIEWVEDPQRADSSVHRGHTGVRESWERWLEGFDEYRFEAEQFVDCGNDVLVVAREHGRGIASGATVSSRIWAVLTIRNGKLLRYREFYDERAARQGAGLEGWAMSQGKVEVTRDLVQKWNAGVRTAREYFDPAVEIVTPFSSVSGEPYRGYAGIEQWTREIDEQFAEWQILLDDVREVGNATIAVASIRGRGRGSDIEFAQPSAAVMEFGSDDRITRIRIYLHQADALKAVGLEGGS